LLLISWKQIVSLVHKDTVIAPIEIQKRKKKEPVSKKTATTLKHQQYYTDIGCTTGKYLIDKDNIGVSFPVLKPFTDKLHVKAMVALSGIFKHHIFEDLRDTAYFDMVNTTCCRDFAHQDNMLEALVSSQQCPSSLRLP
jgi:hypothetical protein